MSNQLQMISDIEREVAYTRHMIGRSALSGAVMQAIREVPREAFVPAAERRFAYDNGPLPIGCGQTISQPYIVALMTDLLEVGEDAVVLEVGTGSGYQAAVLSRVVKRVYSVEVIETLSLQATETLQKLGYENVSCRHADGYHGWPEHAPYDGILVTAAAVDVPAPLVDQLKPGARLVIPVGQPYGYQDLIVAEKSQTGEVSEKTILGVAFVPLTRSNNHFSQYPE
ncbi:MAG: protein-L-isoaspartate(D-aspartate) O-methyltransferase [Candidatus Thiodiazotropha taylori]|nr:protein-L-isoaspartate(D-aspartate) O-methyltransferase [Candidatus Thiodiazotropha taylori]MCW4225166.1 protein-L-isoaspartate(D-aspartate) O-methyltransferase [Candidatus Thiodiazotropha endolucinida]MCG7884258.1 protein-L-isoaspartate(D-aspartate) O-methyltransferase [Candidatus Thiodiazotropha taylori]MCG7886737.1 protein-L-isoaspartate(D-aspartate) O-methyltransferase [Candidatus Thiodiazotropha taylori]MCG7891472.1 protein-L-isoaspartate(D-aspartate) O-methyltransferase [Candidatus Thi